MSVEPLVALVERRGVPSPFCAEAAVQPYALLPEEQRKLRVGEILVSAGGHRVCLVPRNDVPVALSLHGEIVQKRKNLFLGAEEIDVDFPHYPAKLVKDALAESVLDFLKLIDISLVSLLIHSRSPCLDEIRRVCNNQVHGGGIHAFKEIHAVAVEQRYLFQVSTPLMFICRKIAISTSFTMEFPACL